MSRTDKDTPWWTRENVWWEPWHNPRCLHYSYERFCKAAPDPSFICTLPPEPKVTGQGLPHYAHRLLNPDRDCIWVADWPHGRNWQPRPPKWYLDHVWNNPMRVKVRDKSRQAVKEYRATGEVDVELPLEQHRHCAHYYYW